MIKIKTLDFNKYRHSQSEGTETFDKPEALEINIARLEHLNSLNLSLAKKKVIDIGCGVGHLAQFFVKIDCDVLAIDGRIENLEALGKKYPLLKHTHLDVEKDDLSKLGKFDIVFCYGLLYHTENPVLVVEKISQICSDLLLLETCITDYDEPLVKYVEETATASQALKGMGSRPTPALVTSLLYKNNFQYIYWPKTLPLHQDFQFKYQNNLSHLKNGHNIRQIFIASKDQPLNNQNLVLLDGQL